MPEQSKDRLFCPNCGLGNIRPSLRHGFIDDVLRILRLGPFRCRNCRQRFYRFSRHKNESPPVAFRLVQATRPLSILEEPAPIPEPTAVAQESSPQMPPPDLDEPRSILVVDSDLSIRKLLHRVLEREGYRIHELGHATNLLRELRSARVDLLITDLDMPQQEGLDTIGTLAGEFPDVKIIVLSGSFKVRGLPANVVILAKPFRTEALLDSVRTALDRTEAPRAVR